MLDWNDLRYFLAIARGGTLARASRDLGINATTVGRRLVALEEEVQARLFDRTPDGYVLTPSGRDLLPRAERMEGEAIALDRDVIGADQRPSGAVRLTATEMLATRFIMPHMPRFHATHPEITLELECTTRVVSLARREADIALRLARPREDNVVGRRLASVPLSLYAAPSYVAERGLPEGSRREPRGALRDPLRRRPLLRDRERMVSPAPRWRAHRAPVRQRQLDLLGHGGGGRPRAPAEGGGRARSRPSCTFPRRPRRRRGSSGRRFTPMCSEAPGCARSSSSSPRSSSPSKTRSSRSRELGPPIYVASTRRSNSSADVLANPDGTSASKPCARASWNCFSIFAPRASSAAAPSSSSTAGKSTLSSCAT